MAGFLERFRRHGSETGLQQGSKGSAGPDKGEYSLHGLAASPLFGNSPKSDDDQELISHARSLMQNGALAEATSVVQDGLRTCTRKDLLCVVMGDICLETHDPAAIGWYMQACLIASPSWEPYLAVSYGAGALGLEDMRWRCLNACDVIKSAPRVPELDHLIGVLVSGHQSEVREAMRVFEEAMDPYLPSSDELPHDGMGRSIFLRQCMEFDPEKPPYKQRLRLLKRGD